MKEKQGELIGGTTFEQTSIKTSTIISSSLVEKSWNTVCKYTVKYGSNIAKVSIKVWTNGWSRLRLV